MSSAKGRHSAKRRHTAKRRHSAKRREIGAGAALAAVGAIAATATVPVAPPTAYADQTAKLDVRLAAATGASSSSSGGSASSTSPSGSTSGTSPSGSTSGTSSSGSISNIPLNLLYAVANVPYNETQAINQLGASLLFGGTWWVASATNVWGEDPGDPGHFEALVNMLVPFPVISNPLGYDVAMVAAAELPASNSCDAETCAPLTPVTPITGITSLDHTLNLIAVLTGLSAPMPMFQNWSKVSLQQLLNGYTFPSDLTNPSGPVNSEQLGNFFFQGTTGSSNLLPWAGTTFTLDPTAPLKDFYQSLTQTPATNGVAGTGIQAFQPSDVLRSLQTLLAGVVVDFNPFVPGSPECTASCPLTGPNSRAGITSESIVQAIGNLYPGNQVINDWLNDVQAGTANGPTQTQVEISQRLLQTGTFTFDQKTTAAINTALASINPALPDVVRDSGLLEGWQPVDPTNPGGAQQQYGGYNPNALLKDLDALVGINSTTTTPAPTTPAPSTANDKASGLYAKLVDAVSTSLAAAPSKPATVATAAPSTSGATAKDQVTLQKATVADTPAKAPAAPPAADSSVKPPKTTTGVPSSGTTHDADVTSGKSVTKDAKDTKDATSQPGGGSGIGAHDGAAGGSKSTDKKDNTGGGNTGGRHRADGNSSSGGVSAGTGGSASAGASGTSGIKSSPGASANGGGSKASTGGNKSNPGGSTASTGGSKSSPSGSNKASTGGGGRHRAE